MKYLKFSLPIILLLFSGTPLIRAQDPPPPPPPRPIPVPTVETPAKSTVRGRIFYENTGRPVRRAPIILISENSGVREVQAQTDNNGSFQIKNVKAGTYYAFINAPGVVTPLAFADMSQSKKDGFDEAVEGFPPIVVNGINDVEVQIPARQGGAISGRITYSDGDPVIGARVEILRRANDQLIPVIPNFSAFFSLVSGIGGGVQTDDRGVYRLSGLPAGDYFIRVSEGISHGGNPEPGPGSFAMFASGDALVAVYYPNAFEVEKAQSVPVITGQEMYDVNLTIPDRRLYRIEGKIISAKDKTPLEGARLKVTKSKETVVSIFGPMSKNGPNSQTDENGNWSFNELPPGTYQLLVEPDNYGSTIYEKESEDLSDSPTGGRAATPPKYASTIREITIADKDLREIVVEVGYGAAVSGTVVTENSKEMPENVLISLSGEIRDLSVRGTVFNYKGEFPAQPGVVYHDFQLDNVAPGKSYFKFTVEDEDYYVKSATLDKLDLLNQPVELKEGDDLKNIKVVLAKDVGTIKGTVLNADKQPAGNKKFALVPVATERRRSTSFYRFVASDRNGGFTVKAAPGEYAVVIFERNAPDQDPEGFYAWLDEAVNDAHKVTVKAGESSTVTLTIP